jgi:hypothetical protein
MERPFNTRIHQKDKLSFLKNIRKKTELRRYQFVVVGDKDVS